MLRHALLLLALPGLLHARTLGDLRSDARLLVRDSGTTSTRFRFSNSQVNDLINECQRETVAYAWPITKASSFELVAGTTYYSLSNDFLAIRRVTWRNRVLDEKSPKALDSMKEWETVSGSPINYFVTFSSRTLIGIYPFPADSTSTGTVKVEFFSQADELTADANVPFNGIREFYPLHHLLAYCAAGKMAAIDGQSDLAGLYFKVYSDGVGRLSETAPARPNYTPSLNPSRGGP